MWSFWFRLLFIHDLPSIKAAPFLYYTSVLISTKITTVLSLWDSYWTRPRGLMKLKDWDYLQAQHTSWSLVLPYGRNHGTFTSPSEAPATSQFHIGFLCGSVLNRNKGNRDKQRGVRDVTEIEWTWGWRRHSGEEVAQDGLCWRSIGDPISIRL